MKKISIILLALVFVFGCAKQSKNKEIVATVNDYELTKEEFLREFKDSIYASNDTLESRKEFLNNLIDRKLILQEAQVIGLDKEKSFLKVIEKFWEQSLLKIAVDKKAREISGSIFIDDDFIRKAYNELVESGGIDHTYEEMYEQIKWELTRLKESQLINDWVVQLRKSAKLKINPDLLNKKE